MITSPESWRHHWDRLNLPPSAVPVNPDFGRLYPWDQVMGRAMSYAHRRKVEIAKERIHEAVALHPGIRLGWSAGKDSTAIAALLQECGVSVPAFGEKDDLDYPGEEVYLRQVGAAVGMVDVQILRPDVSLLAFLKERNVSLVNDLHGQTANLSRDHFYGLLRRHRKEEGYNAVFLGLRSNESKHRAVNRASHGPIYERKSDALIISQPICDWEDIDVHAYVASRDIPLMPLYLCVDPGMDALKLRKSWFVAGGGAARYGHYVWLRRWWPNLWDRIADIDPEVRRMS